MTPCQNIIFQLNIWRFEQQYSSRKGIFYITIANYSTSHIEETDGVVTCAIGNKIFYRDIVNDWVVRLSYNKLVNTF